MSQRNLVSYSDSLPSSFVSIGFAILGGAILGAFGTAIMGRSGKKRRRKEVETDEDVSSSSSSSEDETNECTEISLRQKLVMVVNAGLITGSKKKRMMQEGKMAAQCCHAAVACCMASQHSANYKIWEYSGGAKIALKTSPPLEWLTKQRAGATESGDSSSKKMEPASPSEHVAYMRAIRRKANAAGLKTYLVADAGHTQLEPGTVTVLGIGPGPVHVIDKITGKNGMLPCKLVQ